MSQCYCVDDSGSVFFCMDGSELVLLFEDSSESVFFCMDGSESVLLCVMVVSQCYCV